MKSRALVISVLLVVCAPVLGAEGVSWAPSIRKAKELAAERGTLVFVAAVIDREPANEAQKKAYEDPAFVKASRSVVCVLANPMGEVPRILAWNELIADYGHLFSDRSGDFRIPFHVVIDPGGKVVTTITNGTPESGFDTVPAKELVRALEDLQRKKRSAYGVSRPPAGRAREVIDHADPSRYARIPESAGSAELIRRSAEGLKAETPLNTIRRIHAFIADRIPDAPESSWGPDHRNFDRLLRGFDHTGCASHGLLFANLARACGIPVVYLKSMRHSWIREFMRSGKRGGFSGHVFLEVFLDGAWRLLDAQGMRIWEDYDPADPELPGELLAYEKGWDHFAMVHSTRRDLYIEEDVERWRGFEPGRLRPNRTPGRRLLPKIYAITQCDEWRALGARLRMEMAFDLYHWPEYREKVMGNVFIVTAVGGRTELPEKESEEWLPVPLEKLREEALTGVSAVHSGTLENGTRVLVLSAPGRREMMRLIWDVDMLRLVCDLVE